MSRNILSRFLRLNEKYKTGKCPDPQCQSSVVFSTSESMIECISCGQRHPTTNLNSIEDVDSNFFTIIKSRMSKNGNTKPHELVKVCGISNFECVLISHLVSCYTVSKEGHPEVLSATRTLSGTGHLDCSKLFSSRTYLISPAHISIRGFGVDNYGQAYLQDTLDLIKAMNNGEDRLIPLHADGDGHCLVHAISKCLMGREMYWHALRVNLSHHLRTYLEQYKETLKDFVAEDDCEWDTILKEAEPDYLPPEDQMFGLRTIHIFALSNVLRRPIILFDSMKHINMAGDFVATFLPAFHPTSECVDAKTGELNKPIVVAWNNNAHNHFIPLVGVKGKELPVLFRDFLPKVWGVDQSLLDKYIYFEDDTCVVGGNKTFPDSWVQKTYSGMESLFTKKYGVSAELVSEFNCYIAKKVNLGSLIKDLMGITKATRSVLEENKLFRCLGCRQLAMPDESENTTVSILNKLGFAGSEDSLLPVVMCDTCGIASQCRIVRIDGSIIFQNGDRTNTRSVGSKCGCGYKHWWDGKEYDNLPTEIPLKLSFNQKEVEPKVYWFEDEADPSLNSNAYNIATTLVNDYFPGEFGSESIVRKVVDMLINGVTMRQNERERLRLQNMEKERQLVPELPQPMDSLIQTTGATSTNIPTKIIQRGPLKVTFHHEDLGMSKTEEEVKNRIKKNAPINQARASDNNAKKNSLKPSPISPIKTSEPIITNKPVKKTFKLTCKKGDNESKSIVIEIQPEFTFGDLCTAAEKEFQIPKIRQRFKYAYPSKILKMEYSQQLKLTPSEHIILEDARPVIKSNLQSSPRPSDVGIPIDSPSKLVSDASSELALATELIHSLTNPNATRDLFPTAANHRGHFQNGGIYYKQFMQLKGTSFPDGQHFTIPFFPNKTFVYSLSEDEFMLCLDSVHIPVQPITPELTKSIQKKKEILQVSEFVSNLIPLRQSESKIEAFSGQGSRLVADTPEDEMETIDIETELNSNQIIPNGEEELLTTDLNKEDETVLNKLSETMETQ